MFRHEIWPLLLALAAMVGEASAAGDVVVIANPNLTKLNAGTVGRLYLGRVIEVDGIPVTAVNVAAGSGVRSRFLLTYLNCDDDTYVGYWTTRKYNGLGAPPKELPSSADVINYVKSTPGAVGYVDESDLRPGLNMNILQTRSPAPQARRGERPSCEDVAQPPA